jgi:hypothetical protein
MGCQMGYEKFEREFPCPCGKGVQVAEWEEHDTWVSGNEGAEYALKCPDCAARLVYFYHGALQFWARKEDKERLDKYAGDAGELRKRGEKLIVERCEQAFVDHVMRLPNRMTKKAATGAGRGFLKKATDPAYVEATAREAIRHHPQRCFAELKSPDSEIENLFAMADQLKQEERAFAEIIEKIGIPDKRFGFKVFGQ